MLSSTLKELSLSRQLGLAVMGLTILFFAYDLIVDAFVEGEFGTPHFTIEAVVFVAVSWTLAVNLRELVGLSKRLNQEVSRNQILAGELADGIDAQMQEWGLTRSEKEVAWLIIKGYRFAEIARLRQVKENTTRLQATTVYAKAGVNGRAEFVAEVIHQLLMPIEDGSVVSDRGYRAAR